MRLCLASCALSGAATGDFLLMVPEQNLGGALLATGSSFILRFGVATGITTLDRTLPYPNCSGLALRSDGWLATVRAGEEIRMVDPDGGDDLITPLGQPLASFGTWADVAFDVRGLPVVSSVNGLVNRVGPIDGSETPVPAFASSFSRASKLTSTDRSTWWKARRHSSESTPAPDS